MTLYVTLLIIDLLYKTNRTITDAQPKSIRLFS